MVSVLCVGLGELLTFSAMVLAILVNMGQISNNIVARSIYYTSLNTNGLETAITSANGGTAVTDIFATSQAAPELAGNGIKTEYRWGLYNFCAGATSGSNRACTSRSFGYQYRPLEVLEQDATAQNRGAIVQAVPTGTFSNSDYLGRFSGPASYLAFVGTVVIGVSFLTAFLAHRFAFLLASLLALAASGCLFVAAAIWTALIFKTRRSLANGSTGVTVQYGNALWMEWAAAAAAFLSVVPLLIACLSGRRSKY